MITKMKKLILTIIFLFSITCIPLYSYGKSDITLSDITLSDIISSWVEVLNLIENNDFNFTDESLLKFENFKEQFAKYENSNESYVNILINASYEENISKIKNSLDQLSNAIAKKSKVEIMNQNRNISRFLFAISLEETKVMKRSSLANLYILISSLILIFLLCVFVFIIITRFEKLRKESKELGYYSDSIIEGVQNERRRISRELHDTICQDLRTARIETELLNISEDDVENKNKQASIVNMLTKNITDLREICNSLTPGMGKNDKNASVWQTFTTSLNNFLESFVQRTQISCNKKIDTNLDSGNLSFYKCENIFGIIREAFNNIEKHSQATEVSILIRNDESNHKKTVLIFIIDNGIGFEKVPSMGFHFGLENIKQRANELSASFEINSEKDDGTKIRLEVPIE